MNRITSYNVCYTKLLRSLLEKQNPVYDSDVPNEYWSGDFKGQFRMKNHEYCYPLTIMDTATRFLIAIVGLDRPTMEYCKPILDKIFREYGLPIYFHTDNGAPFGNSQALRRMTQYAVWLMDVGVTPVYSDPGCPQQNGKHERMHRDLKAEVTRPAASSMVRQQRAFDSYNFV